MNAWQIVGGVVSILGTILMFYGSYQQTQGDKEFQDTVENYVEKQQAEDSPELVALAVEKRNADYLLTVQNIGRKPATQVRVIFSTESKPTAFSGNLISGAQKIPHNTRYTFPLNLFTGINRIMNLPNSVEGYKEELETSLQKFNTGEMAFIPRFYLEYHYGEKLITSPMYYLVLEKQRGLLRFGKEDSNVRQ
ncbi:MAG: hypothetical protein PHW66_01570 [Gallionella sp.]|nr:hypothetical protein [Gallionella sp.]